MSEQNEWYSNKALYEMMVELSKRLETTDKNLAVTTTLITKYNGLRERLEACEGRLKENEGIQKGGKDVWGYVVGGIGLLLAILSRFN